MHAAVRDDGIVDEVAIDRAMRGDLTVSLTRRELVIVWHALEAQGLSSDHIAYRLGVSKRTVVRWRNGRSRPSSRPGIYRRENTAA